MERIAGASYQHVVCVRRKVSQALGRGSGAALLVARRDDALAVCHAGSCLVARADTRHKHLGDPLSRGGREGKYLCNRRSAAEEFLDNFWKIPYTFVHITIYIFNNLDNHTEEK